MPGWLPPVLIIIQYLKHVNINVEPLECTVRPCLELSLRTHTLNLKPYSFICVERSQRLIVELVDPRQLIVRLK